MNCVFVVQSGWSQHIKYRRVPVKLCMHIKSVFWAHYTLVLIWDPLLFGIGCVSMLLLLFQCVHVFCCSSHFQVLGAVTSKSPSVRFCCCSVYMWLVKKSCFALQFFWSTVTLCYICCSIVCSFVVVEYFYLKSFCKESEIVAIFFFKTFRKKCRPLWLCAKADCVLYRKWETLRRVEVCTSNGRVVGRVL